ncbi:SPJ_0845 family protein [Streptococcus sciuri]|uniref:SPJ_0845 family protein n=1 Tax=Streptococcus sciuri TaxID=2973939 RepID=A0ABT2F757_9STRE|nr:SPJ_0845 family protein [Streptococcus sciuri]MCS4488326.1 SPJ_0845 family protein [Streptococcus sciuri]
MAITHKRQEDLERRFAEFATIIDPEQEKKKPKDAKDKKDRKTI